MTPNTIPHLTDCEQTYIAQFMQLIQLICDRTKSVVYGYALATYIAGRTGTGKTFNVLEELQKHDVPWCYRNARVTAMGLFDLLRQHPEHVIVLDDVPSIFKDKAALQILLAALDGDPQKPREITYKSKDKDERFEFVGGLILTGNVPIGHDPMARAVAGRVMLLNHDPDDSLLAAYTKHLALRGYKDLEPEECWQVADFVIAEKRASNLRLDLRHYFKGVEDLRQYKHGYADTPWQVLVKTNLQKAVREFVQAPSKAEDFERQREVVVELCGLFPDDVKRQQEEFTSRTGYAKSAFHERRRELKTTGLLKRKSA